MNKNYFQSLLSVRYLMILLNLIIVIFYGFVFLFTTKYIITNQLSRNFLDTVNSIPRNPLFVLLVSILLYLVLVFMIYYHNENKIINNKFHIFYNVLELVICFVIIYLLNMSYNGIILLVFSDCIYHFKNEKTKWFLLALVIIDVVSNDDIFSMFISIPNPQAAVEACEASMTGMLMVSKNLLETLNILLFVASTVLYIADQIQENENISKELDMINQVNQELQNYAAITEKIGENNERKRLAREIHDTLGHALTGIAAGIDACIAMIDINPQTTKQQLQLVSKVVRQGISDVRNSLNKLRPGALEANSFKGAIETMIDEFTNLSDLVINLHYQIDKLDLENTTEDILFRIIQESITNAMRHGRAKCIDIEIFEYENLLYLKIKDDGIGCKEIHYGFGLKQMQERVAIINGEVIYDGHDGFLTEVKIPIGRGERYD